MDNDAEMAPIAPTAPIIGILLAAGGSRRFGADKLLHPLADGTPLAVAAARRLRPACDRCLAVVRPGNDRLMQLLAAAGYTPVPCPESEAGMGHSLAAGIRAAPDAAAWIVALADMPFIEPASHRRVAAALRAGGSIVVPAYRGRRGHPVGFARQWAARLAALAGDEGARSILAAFPGEIVPCDVDDPGVLRDVDELADLRER